MINQHSTEKLGTGYKINRASSYSYIFSKIIDKINSWEDTVESSNWEFENENTLRINFYKGGLIINTIYINYLAEKYNIAFNSNTVLEDTITSEQVYDFKRMLLNIEETAKYHAKNHFSKFLELDQPLEQAPNQGALSLLQ